ncbi:hypothetical protein GUJ93_ZPchr0001g29808 [Zizania palustris]|uniref:Uncharacterized protein n=1 Tax=Zizania palustris TaxID=103762 RepID=A0A8J5RQU9_ZIZPA|nr:hypothetical protein GUJ93_ZPchr0001g29808 [Zizania palustris]
MDRPYDQAKKPIEIKFSSCRGVTFELKPSPASPFAIDASTGRPSQPPPAVPSTGAGRWVWLPMSSGRYSSFSRIIPDGVGRSRSHASSHFCDLDVGDEDDDDDNKSVVYDGADEEMAVSAAVTVDDGVKDKGTSRSAKAEASRARQSRLGVILFDQGLFTVYKRLFALCVALNAAALSVAAAGHFPYAKSHAAVFAMGNILALTLCRSEAVLRGVFWLAVTLLGRPWVPVVFKTGATAILQSLGGVHSGCGVSSLAWLVYALVQAIRHRDVTPPEIVAVASAILGLLGLSCFAAFPLMRHLHHNVFERTHRFAGWSALGLLWAFVVLSAGYDQESRTYSRLTGVALAKRQDLWLAAAITFFTILPWLTVRRVPVTPLARSPLSEWHAFGIISDGGGTHAMLAGAVGDFTRGLVSNPPSHLWVRGVRFAGLPYLINMYRSATMVATGSGICVFLSLLMQPSPAELSLVWVAKGIEANFGEEIKAAVTGSKNLAGRVIVHDTAVSGRPDVRELAVGVARRWGAEVVVVTSNPEGSRDVVRGCRKAGIPAFGPIWDS